MKKTSGIKIGSRFCVMKGFFFTFERFSYFLYVTIDILEKEKAGDK